MGRAESNLDELFTQQTVVGRIAERSVVLDGFVDHIPAVNLTFVVTHNGLDMLDKALLQHFLRGRTGGVTVSKPPVWGL